MTLIHTMTFNKQEALEQLKKGNTDVLNDLHPAATITLGIALQNESDYKEPSPIDSKEVGKAMLDRMADSGVKEMLTKQVEQEEKERAEKVELAKQITDSMNITKEVTGE